MFNHWEEEARLKWEKQKYRGEALETMCKEQQVCEPLLEFQMTIGKD